VILGGLALVIIGTIWIIAGLVLAAAAISDRPIPIWIVLSVMSMAAAIVGYRVLPGSVQVFPILIPQNGCYTIADDSSYIDSSAPRRLQIRAAKASVN
jgi:hypothetical protein